MPVCPVFAAGLDGKCCTGKQRLQGGPDRDRLPAAGASANASDGSALPVAAPNRLIHAAKRQFGQRTGFIVGCRDNSQFFKLPPDFARDLTGGLWGIVRSSSA